MSHPQAPPPPPPTGMPPQDVPPPPRRSRPGLVVAVVVAAIVAAGGGVAGALFLTGQDSGSPGGEPRKVSSERQAPRPGDNDVDRPEDPPTFEGAGDGGTIGVAVRNALQTAGFGCGTVAGPRGSLLVCDRTERKPAPTTHRVLVGITGTGSASQVVQVRADVELDPSWREILDRVNVRSSAHRTFSLLAGAAIPPGERETVEEALRKADQSATSTTSVGEIRASFGPSSSRFTLTARAGGVGGTDSGLRYVAPKELQQTVEKVGLSCTRGNERLTCEKEAAELTVEFPDLGAEGQYVTGIELTSRTEGTPSEAFVETARAVGRVVADKYGVGSEADGWIGRCFGTGTKQAVFGATEFRCRPDLTGDADDPRIVRQHFEIGAAPRL